MARERRTKSRASRAAAHPRRECIALSDPTDCLLEAYDSVAHRAHQKFLDRGAASGGELEDWLNAERELLPEFPVNVEESGECVYALASFPGVADARVSVGIESRWLVILAHPAAPNRRAHGTWKDGPAVHSVCVLELPSDVDPSRSIAVLSDGVLGIRMPKCHADGGAEGLS
jgi:HSP20 family molecular chaperone IbpA